MALGFSLPSSKRTSTLSVYNRSCQSIMKLRFSTRWVTASGTTATALPFSSPFFRFSAPSRALLYMNFTVAPWLVVKRRMGVKVLMYLKPRKMGEDTVLSYTSEWSAVRSFRSTFRSYTMLGKWGWKNTAGAIRAVGSRNFVMVLLLR